MTKLMPVEKLSQHLILWIEGKVANAGCNGVVFGMSGGVDSSVVAVLCKRAFPDTCLGIIMPCHSDNMDRIHAELVADKFKVPTKMVVLDGIFDSIVNVLPVDTSDSTTKKTAESNIKPRLRMLTLYNFANRLNYLVVGSGNRCELYVGYFTKYGDGGVDIMPLGNLTKGQVRELAAYLGLPKVVIDKSPSAGLWRGQTDEGEMGLTYDELDRYLLTGKAEAKVKKKIELLAKKSSHKKCLPPVPPF